MPEPVTVAGITIDQDKLERIFEALRLHDWLGMPAELKPRLWAFGPATGPVASYEQAVYELIRDGTLARVEWFRAQFMGSWVRPF